MSGKSVLGRGLSNCGREDVDAKLGPAAVADVAEWLRRLTRNQFPSGSVGSNPTVCGRGTRSVRTGTIDPQGRISYSYGGSARA
jgi:hypothetical protein